jgi:hypothetical protein
MFALMCSTADAANSLTSTATINGTQNISAGTITKSSIKAGELTHTHGITITNSDLNFAALNFPAGVQGTVVSVCSHACATGAVAVGGDCTFFGGTNNPCGSALGAITASQASADQKTWCCSGYLSSSANPGAVCNLNAVAHCIGGTTGNGL